MIFATAVLWPNKSLKKNRNLAAGTQIKKRFIIYTFNITK